MKPRKPIRKQSLKIVKGRVADQAARQACFEKALGMCLCAHQSIWGPCDSYPGGPLLWCHLITRGRQSLRRHPDNSVALCPYHERYFTNNPAEFRRLIDLCFPGRWEALAELERAFKPCNTQQEKPE